MTADLLSRVPARQGHFLLESGYHTDLWLTLDALFVDSASVAPLVDALADKCRPHAVSGICGPLFGGAFLAQALAAVLAVRFYYTEPVPTSAQTGLFKTAYRLPSELARRARGECVAVVDDVISAGSSVRATIAAMTAAGASTRMVGSFIVLGDAALSHFADVGMPVEALDHRAFRLWKPADCPLCREEHPLEDARTSS
jgi:orotate phosphoribosyltransferase